MEAFLGQVQIFGYNFTPRNWAFCDGQLLSISQYEALFSLLGTIYGGDGRTTFALPDLRGRIPVHTGRGAGLQDIRIGQRGGVTDMTLTSNNLPSHSHAGTLRLGAGPGLEGTGNGAHLASNSAGETLYTAVAPAADQLAADSLMIGNTGGNQSFNISNPYLGIGYSICLFGLYPSRN